MNDEITLLLSFCDTCLSFLVGFCSGGVGSCFLRGRHVLCCDSLVCI